MKNIFILELIQWAKIAIVNKNEQKVKIYSYLFFGVISPYPIVVLILKNVNNHILIEN